MEGDDKSIGCTQTLAYMHAALKYSKTNKQMKTTVVIERFCHNLKAFSQKNNLLFCSKCLLMHLKRQTFKIL